MSTQLKRIGVHVLVCGFLAPMSKIVKKYHLGVMEVNYPLGNNSFMQKLGMDDPDLCSVIIEHENYVNEQGNEIALFFNKHGKVDVNNALEHPRFQQLDREMRSYSFSRPPGWNNTPLIPWLHACVAITRFYEIEAERLIVDPVLFGKVQRALERACESIKFAFMAVGNNINNWPMEDERM